MEEILEILNNKEFIEAYHKPGSNYICDPPVTNTDIDYIVLVDDILIAHKFITKNGFRCDVEKKYILDEDRQFLSYKRYVEIDGEKKIINFITTELPFYYKSFVFATELAKKLNIRDKTDRVDLFRIIREYWRK